VRLDPFSLPLRFAAEDVAADEAIRHVELHRERVILRRAVRGMRYKLNLPLTTYLGLLVRQPHSSSCGETALVLQHRDPALSVPLFVASDHDDLTAISETWARVLRLPLLSAGDQQGAAHQPALKFAAPIARRRRRRGDLKARRPSILSRRKPGKMSKDPTIHCEDEIIARD
jgi:hypothetical protein